MEKATGEVAGSLRAERLAVSNICPVTEIYIQSAAGSSDGCYGSLSQMAVTRKIIFELTGLCSGASKKTVVQLLS